MNTKKLNTIIAVVMFFAIVGYSQSAFSQQTTQPEKPKADEIKVEKPKQNEIKAEELIQKESKTEKPEAESSPTLEETAAWLKSKIEANKVQYVMTQYHPSSIDADNKPVYTYNDLRQEVSYTDFSIKKCEISWKSRSVAHFQDSKPLEQPGEHTLGSLSSYDPLSFKVSERVGSDQAKFKPIVYQISPSGDNDGYWFQFTDRELAKRVAKALSHAAKLCGGKVEPF